MDREQIKKKIEDKISNWSIILFSNNVVSWLAIAFLLSKVFLNIGIIMIVIYDIINFFGLIALLEYVNDIIEENYNEKTLEYEKLEIIITILNFSLIYALIILVMLPLKHLYIIIITVIYAIIWFIIKFKIDAKIEKLKTNKNNG